MLGAITVDIAEAYFSGASGPVRESVLDLLPGELRGTVEEFEASFPPKSPVNRPAAEP
jgi:hypothetical protein